MEVDGEGGKDAQCLGDGVEAKRRDEATRQGNETARCSAADFQQSNKEEVLWL
jgi:hypothetical protein